MLTSISRLAGDGERVVNSVGSYSPPENKTEDEPERIKPRDTLAKKSTLTLCIVALITLSALFVINVYGRLQFQTTQSDLIAQAIKWYKLTNDTRLNCLKDSNDGKKGRRDRSWAVKPWFMAGGTLYPSVPATGVASGLWPSQQQLGDDRIVNQLMFQPPAVSDGSQVRLKTILIFNGLDKIRSLPTSGGSTLFSKCPVNTCEITLNRSMSQIVDAIIYDEEFVFPGHQKSSGQVWVMHFYESPYFTPHFQYSDVFNMTSSYRTDSDLVHPYGKYVYYNSSVRQLRRPLKNYAANKTKQVAWFVSNCKAHNGRMEYARKLQKYISVDIYGNCGTNKCSINHEEQCFKLLENDYKFYLAFENSNCKDYITEKFFRNGLKHNVLPIVMGARPEEYKLVAPEHSYIHVDEFDSPQALARYLLLLDKNDDMYNSYFKWKGTGEFIDTHFWCRLCALLHDTRMPSKSFTDINRWWSGPGTCSPGYSKYLKCLVFNTLRFGLQRRSKTEADRMHGKVPFGFRMYQNFRPTMDRKAYFRYEIQKWI